MRIGFQDDVGFSGESTQEIYLKQDLLKLKLKHKPMMMQD